MVVSCTVGLCIVLFRLLVVIEFPWFWFSTLVLALALNQFLPVLLSSSLSGLQLRDEFHNFSLNSDFLVRRLICRNADQQDSNSLACCIRLSTHGLSVALSDNRGSVEFSSTFLRWFVKWTFTDAAVLLLTIHINYIWGTAKEVHFQGRIKNNTFSKL